jgi:hypothetical protein
MTGKQGEPVSCSDLSEAGLPETNEAAANRLQAFVRALPSDIPIPELSTDPDGAISLDWVESRDRLFSLSIGHNHRLAYAWIHGGGHGHGVAEFNGAKIPNDIIQQIRAILGSSAAPIRSDAVNDS